jgi:hypothetical protein
MSLATTLIHVLCTAVAAAFVISFAEFAIHRHLMHRQRLPSWVYRALPDLRAQFKNHAVLHHGTYYREFDHEPDPAGRTFNVRILWGDTLRLILTFSPLMLVLWFLVSPASSLTFLAMIVLHNLAWGVVHMQMHVPQEDCWFADSGYFRFISRHHFMHHRQTGKNYNVVVPFADFVLGRVAQRRPSDVREMLRLGHLSPRRATSVRLIERLRAEHLAARAHGMSAHGKAAHDLPTHAAAAPAQPVSPAEAEAMFANELVREIVDGT